VSPFSEKRLIGRASSDVAADGHSTEGAAVVALPARNDAVAVGLATFEMKLPGELYGGFGGLRTARGEIDAAARAEIGRAKSKKARGQFFGRGRMELSSVRKGEPRGLLSHCTSDFGDAMADVDYRGLAAGVQIAAAALIDDPAALTANSDWIGLAEVSREERGVGRHDYRRIVAEEELTKGKY